MIRRLIGPKTIAFVTAALTAVTVECCAESQVSDTRVRCVKICYTPHGWEWFEGRGTPIVNGRKVRFDSEGVIQGNFQSETRVDFEADRNQRRAWLFGITAGLFDGFIAFFACRKFLSILAQKIEKN